MNNQIETEQPKPQLNEINYTPVFPVLTASVLLDLPIEDMVKGMLEKAVDLKNYTGGYTTYFNGENIDNVKGVAELKEAIYGICCSMARELKYSVNYEKCALRVWANVMRKDNYHEMHNHPGALFSGTFYAQTDDTMSPLVLKNPNFMYRGQDPISAPQDMTPFTATFLTILPKVNQLYIWPAWMEHFVPEMKVSGPRVSFSFSINFLPVGA